MENSTKLSDVIQGNIDALRTTAIAGIETELARLKESAPKWAKMSVEEWEGVEIPLNGVADMGEPFVIYGSGKFVGINGDIKEEIGSFPLSDLLCMLSELEIYADLHKLNIYQ